MNLTGNLTTPAAENLRFMTLVGIGLWIELPAMSLLLPSMSAD